MTIAADDRRRRNRTHSQCAKLVLQSVRALRAGKPRKALVLAEEAVRHGPADFDALQVLGFIQRELGEAEAAIRYFERARAVNPHDSGLLANLGGAYDDMGLSKQAERVLLHALQIDPENADALRKLGMVCQRAGRLEEAKQILLRAIQADPTDPWPYFTISGLVYREGSPAQAIEALQAALVAHPGHGPTLFQLAVMAFRLGDQEGSATLMASIEGLPESYRTSWDYARSHASDASMFGNTWDTLDHALACCTVDGPILEFGVRHGASTRFIAKRFSGEIHGFDSFEGLPEDWGPEKIGAYTTHGVLPEVPDNVSLHPGWFEDTLPPFDLNSPVRLVHVDCDIYSSTVTIFENLAAQIVPGSIIVFDEYFMNATWRDDEHKAFREAVAENNWSYEYIGYSFFSKQAAVQLTG